MKKTLIIIAVLIVVIAAAAGIFLWKKGGSGNIGAASGSGLGALPVASPAAVTSSTLSPGPLPSDTPQGDMFALQGTGGVVTVKNFYRTGQGYFPSVDAVMLEKNASYTIWYYRSISNFEIWFLPGAGTATDEAAAAQALENDLGISEKALCTLSAGEVFQFDGGATTEAGPLRVCSSGAFQ